LADLIVIGSYPKDKAIKRTVQFFNGKSGKLAYEIPTPANMISSLNAFNPTGDYLAFTQSTSFIQIYNYFLPATTVTDCN